MTTAIITGGSRGIGRAIVLALAERGVSVTFTYQKSAEGGRSPSEAAGREGLLRKGGLPGRDGYRSLPQLY